MNSQNIESPKIMKESKNKIKVDFERSPLADRLKAKFLSMSFLGNTIWYIFRLIILIGIAYVVLFPFFTKIAGSFISRDYFTNVMVKLIAMNPTLDTYKAIITDNNYFEALFNTTVLSVLCGVSQTLICSIIGYGFAKFKFKFKNLLFLCVIFTMIVPHETIQLSMFMKFRYFDIWGIYGGINNLIINLGEMFAHPDGFMAGYDALAQNFVDSELSYNFFDVLFSNADGTKYFMGNMLNSYWPFAILSLTGLAFKNGLFIYIMRQYFNGVPDELEEAAYVDGAGIIKTFARIIIPMAVPMMVTIFMFSFSWQWSDTFYTGLFFTGTKSTLLLPNIVKIPSSLDTNYVAQMTYEAAIRNTCGILILVPLVVIYMFAQRTLIEGVERSGITG